jgi:hypothetical protein
MNMSTAYYRLKRPFTSVRLSVGGGHTQLSLWVNHAKAGDITLRNDEVSAVIAVLKRDEPAVTKHGIGNGETRLDFMDDDVEDDTLLISEYGELTTLEEIDNKSSNPRTPAAD